ncbi:MAG: FixH family protein [Candidatus Manganitrophaceae bacterium]
MVHRFVDHPILARFSLSSLFLAIGFLPLSGCMMGMHNMGNDSMRQGHPADRAKTVIKEFHEKRLAVSVEIPDLHQGRESTFMIRIRETAGGEPIAGAKVIASVRPVGRHTEGRGVFVERQAIEDPEQGLYRWTQSFEETGSYEITFNVWPGGDQTGPPLTLSAVEEVKPPVAMRNRPSMTFLYVIGGGAMVVMMVLLMAL